LICSKKHFLGAIFDFIFSAVPVLHTYAAAARATVYVALASLFE
jgi:hypothetical protein